MTAVEERLRQLASQYQLAEAVVGTLGAILEFQASDGHASTTVRSPTAAVDRHVADSLVALGLPEVRSARRVADIGAGAGWPGLALAVALPGARVSLVESASRRCRYLERVIEAVGLGNVDVVHARAEEWYGGFGAHDVVTARALAALPVIAEYAAPLLVAGGTLVAWKGRVEADEIKAAAAAAGELGLDALEIADVHPYPGAGPATLHRFRKAAPTPSRFPRRSGMALKRPLGG